MHPNFVAGVVLGLLSGLVNGIFLLPMRSRWQIGSWGKGLSMQSFRPVFLEESDSGRRAVQSPTPTP